MRTSLLPLSGPGGLPIAGLLLLGLLAAACTGDRTPAVEFSTAEMDSAAAQLRESAADKPATVLGFAEFMLRYFTLEASPAASRTR